MEITSNLGMIEIAKECIVSLFSGDNVVPKNNKKILKGNEDRVMEVPIRELAAKRSLLTRMKWRGLKNNDLRARKVSINANADLQGSKCICLIQG